MMKSFFIACALLLFVDTASAKTAQPSLFIVPGQSLARINLGDTRETVHRKVGKPSHAAKAIASFWWENYGDGEYFYFARTRPVFLEKWDRPKRGGVDSVVYENNQVVQVETGFENYANGKGFSKDAALKALPKLFSNSRETFFAEIPDDQLGNPWGWGLYDYVPEGFAFWTGGMHHPGEPENITTIIVHRPFRLALYFQ